MVASKSARSSTRSALSRPDFLRQAAANLAEGRPGLGQGTRADQRIDRLGLENVQSAVEKSSQGELPRMGQAGAGLQSHAQSLFQNGGAAVAADLDDILPGIRPGGPEIEQKAFVQGRRVFAAAGYPRTRPAVPGRRKARPARTEEAFGDGERPRGRSAGRCRFPRSPGAWRRPRWCHRGRARTSEPGAQSSPSGGGVRLTPLRPAAIDLDPLQEPVAQAFAGDARASG